MASNTTRADIQDRTNRAILHLQDKGLDLPLIYDVMQKISNEIDNENQFKFKSIIDNEIPQGVTLFDMINQDGLTILHLCTQKNMLKCFHTILLAVKEGYSEVDKFQEELVRWVNAVSFKDCFTALHYAAYRGNVEMCQLLIEIGANIQAKNQYGLSVLHIAA